MKKIKNIAKDKKIEEALRESESRFRQFFENEPEYCYMISPKGTIIDVNKTALETLGYSKSELIGKPLKEIYAPESLPKAKELFLKWQKTGNLRDEEMVIITKEGEKRTVLLSAGAVRDKDGKIIHSVSVQKDITERKKAEAALKEKIEELERLNKLMIGRELKMIEMKKEIERLKKELEERKK